MQAAVIGTLAVAAALGTAPVWALQQQEKELELPFELEQNASFAYEIEMESAAPYSDRDERGSDREESGERGQKGRAGREAPAVGGKQHVRVDLSVREKQREATVLHVRVKPTEGGKGRIGDHEEGSGSQDGNQWSSSGETVVFVARVDNEGMILSLDRQSPMAKAGEDDASEGGTDGVQARPASARMGDVTPEKVRFTLEAILGSGLHGKTLKSGEHYRIGGKSKQSAGTNGALGNKSSLPELTLVLKGKSGQEANFDVFGPATKQRSDKGGGQSTDEDSGQSTGERGLLGERNDPQMNDPHGSATYAIDTGHLSTLTYRCPSVDDKESAQGGQGGATGERGRADISGSMKDAISALTIRRVQGGSDTGR